MAGALVSAGLVEAAGTDAAGTGPVPPGPRHRQRPARRSTGLIVAGSVAAAIVLVTGVIVGVKLSSQHPKPGGSPSGASSSSADVGNTGTASLAGTVAAPGGAPMSYAFLSTDGNYIAAAGATSDVYVFSAETLKPVETLAAGGGKADPLAFSPDDKTLYALDPDDNELYDLDIEAGEIVHAYAAPANSLLGYTYGSSVIDAISPGGTVSEYELGSDQLYATVDNPGSAPVAEARPDADGKYLVISDTNGLAYLVDALSRQVTGTFRYAYSGPGSTYPEVSLDGNTVYVPGDSAAPAKRGTPLPGPTSRQRARAGRRRTTVSASASTAGTPSPRPPPSLRWWTSGDRRARPRHHPDRAGRRQRGDRGHRPRCQ